MQQPPIPASFFIPFIHYPSATLKCAQEINRSFTHFRFFSGLPIKGRAMINHFKPIGMPHETFVWGETEYTPEIHNVWFTPHSTKMLKLSIKLAAPLLLWQTTNSSMSHKCSNKGIVNHQPPLCCVPSSFLVPQIWSRTCVSKSFVRTLHDLCLPYYSIIVQTINRTQK